MSRYLQWSRVEHGEPTRIAVTLLAGPVFLGLLPLLVAGIGPRLDRSLGWRPSGSEELAGSSAAC